ncbi:hypothetical protein BC829DRAFT_164845 [Chytridium lagenaria]|nr:hypothetical protein BC829DRAFT_164845 [Chytridium lagenaria]
MNNFGVFMLCGSTALTIPSMERLLCASQIEEATFSNNTLCMVQGAVFMFGSCLASNYASAIIINLHLSLVWRSKIMERCAWLVHVICLALSFGITFPIVFTKSGTTMPTFYCTVQPEKATTWYFAPQAVLLGISVTIHLATAWYIYSVSRGSVDDAKKWVKKQVKMQWRSLLLTFVFVFTWIQFFIIYEIALPKVVGVNSSTPWVVDWIKCVVKNAPNGQSICATSVAAPNVLDMRWIAPCLILGGMVGFWNVLIFITQGTLFKEWHEFFTGIPMDDSSTDSSHGASSHYRSQTTSNHRVSIAPTKTDPYALNKDIKKMENGAYGRERSDSGVTAMSKPEPTARMRSESGSSSYSGASGKFQRPDENFEIAVSSPETHSPSAHHVYSNSSTPDAYSTETQPFSEAFGKYNTRQQR